jgi:cytochrome c-type protein NapB
MRSRIAETILLAAVLACAALAHAAPVVDPMRGTTPVGDSTKPPLMANVENNDIRRQRAYSMQPPTIPHKIDGYQVDIKFNRCLACHAREHTGESQAVPLSVTHYMDREGNVLGEISPRRYFCIQCHVPQADAKPLVGNTFKDVTEVMNTPKKK